MIFGSELRAWAADSTRQRQARRAADRVTTRWAEGPVHQRFTDTMANLPARSAEAVAKAVESLFADDLWVDALIGVLADEMRRDPFFEPPFRHISSDVHKGLIVFEDDNVSIAAGVSGIGNLADKKNARRGSTSVAFSGQASLFKFVKSGGARLSFWRIPRITDTFRAGSAGRCERVGERLITDNEILFLDGRFESFVIEHATSNLVVVQAAIKPDQAPVAAEYDSTTGEFVGCNAADDSASRIQMITTLLRELDHAAAFPVIAAFLEHPNFFVRWHVMRDLLGIDAVAALPHLERMAEADPHAETKAAACAVLARIESSRQTRKAA